MRVVYDGPCDGICVISTIQRAGSEVGGIGQGACEAIVNQGLFEKT